MLRGAETPHIPTVLDGPCISSRGAGSRSHDVVDHVPAASASPCPADKRLAAVRASRPRSSSTGVLHTVHIPRRSRISAPEGRQLLRVWQAGTAMSRAASFAAETPTDNTGTEATTSPADAAVVGAASSTANGCLLLRCRSLLHPRRKTNAASYLSRGCQHPRWSGPIRQSHCSQSDDSASTGPTAWSRPMFLAQGHANNETVVFFGPRHPAAAVCEPKARTLKTQCASGSNAYKGNDTI